MQFAPKKIVLVSCSRALRRLRTRRLFLDLTCSQDSQTRGSSFVICLFCYITTYCRNPWMLLIREIVIELFNVSSIISFSNTEQRNYGYFKVYQNIWMNIGFSGVWLFQKALKTPEDWYLLLEPVLNLCYFICIYSSTFWWARKNVCIIWLETVGKPGAWQTYLKWTMKALTLKAPITTAADDMHKYFFIVLQIKKKRLDVSSESSARQRIHMKNRALFSSKDKSKKLKCRLLQFLFGA